MKMEYVEAVAWSAALYFLCEEEKVTDQFLLDWFEVLNKYVGG
jgi:hypothetical protein